MHRTAAPMLVALALCGCGNSRDVPPDTTTPQLPAAGTKPTTIAGAGLRFTSPLNWPDLPPQGARAGGIRSRTAMVAVWRYRRSEPLPVTTSELHRVQGLLIDRVRRRDPTFELRAARLVRHAGTRGIELLGRQTIAGQRVGVRSSHLFDRGGEVVLDAYAPVAWFDRLDAQVFRPVLRSLRRIRLVEAP